MRWIVSIFFAVWIMIFVFVSNIYCITLYDNLYSTTGVYDKFDRSIVLDNTEDLFEFFRYNGELDTEFFNPSEISHLDDVRVLLGKLQYLKNFLFIISIFLLSFLIKTKKNISKIIRNSGLLILGSIAISGVLYFVIGFDVVFQRFHELFFIGNYSFDPAVSNMKAIFPDAFFMYFILVVIVEIILMGLFLALFGQYYKRVLQKIRQF